LRACMSARIALFLIKFVNWTLTAVTNRRILARIMFLEERFAPTATFRYVCRSTCFGKADLGLCLYRALSYDIGKYT
jgi:hypothetical protein